ncbi:MAG TPA: ATP-binding protein, partial [Pyrinomonadaceae bacterium]|nr:ATP-binding protein [Pyrinomonadaceae bacterium]
MRTFQTQEIKEEGHVGAARRGVRRFASGLGFSDDRLAEIDIVVQEIGTNAVRYASGGGCLHWT